MSYYCDLKSISLEKFKGNLRSQRILPSQEILLEDIDDKFKVLKKNGIGNIQELSDALKNKNMVLAFAKESGISEKYLTVLRREASSYHPVARKFADYKLVSEEIKQKLIALNVKTTAQLFEYVENKYAREKFVCDTGISNDEVILLAKLCDVSRLRYVNAAFAELLIRSSYDTVKKVKSADNIELYEELKSLNEGKKYYTGHIGASDMDFLIRDKANAEIVLDI